MRITLVIFLLAISSLAHAQSQLISSKTARMHGLEKVWNGQLRVDTRYGSMSGGVLHVSSTEGTSVFEVVEGAAPAGKDTPAVEGTVVAKFTDKQLDPFGEPFGKDGAEKRAVLLTAELKKAGRDVSVKAIDVPDMVYVASSSRGMVHCFDAETGETRWTSLVGRRNYDTTGPAVSDKHVAVINGLNLYILERETGEVVFQRLTDDVPVAQPALSNNFAFVLSSSGLMQAYPLYDPKAPPTRYQSHGKSLVRPVKTLNSVVWPTDQGHFYVAPAERGGIKYRIESDRTAVAPAGFLAPYYLYVVATDGYIYCVHERSGGMIWSFPLAEEVTKQPVAIGNSLYVVTDKGNLYCMNAQTGNERWWQARISQVISRSDPYLYCLDTVGRLVTLDMRSGGRVATMSKYLGFEFTEANAATDRIFLATKSGKIQCLRTLGKTYPQIHQGGTESTPAPVAPAAGGAAPPPAAGGGAVADPFAAPAAAGAPAGAPAAPAPDPFAPMGGGAAPDPFAPMGGGAAPDPFAPMGGGAAPDPFAPMGGGAAPDPFAPQ